MIGPLNRSWCHQSQFHPSLFRSDLYRTIGKKTGPANFWSEYENKETASGWHTERQSSICRKDGKTIKTLRRRGECRTSGAAKTMLSSLQALIATCKHPRREHECLPSNMRESAVKWCWLIGRHSCAAVPGYCSNLWTEWFGVFAIDFSFLLLDVLTWPRYSWWSQNSLWEVTVW